MGMKDAPLHLSPITCSYTLQGITRPGAKPLKSLNLQDEVLNPKA